MRVWGLFCVEGDKKVSGIDLLILTGFLFSNVNFVIFRWISCFSFILITKYWFFGSEYASLKLNFLHFVLGWTFLVLMRNIKFKLQYLVSISVFNIKFELKIFFPLRKLQFLPKNYPYYHHTNRKLIKISVHNDQEDLFPHTQIFLVH